jgi:hypothetical protein
MSETKITLYRSVRKEEFKDGVVINHRAVVGVLYPSFTDKEIEIKKGDKVEKKIRRADVYPYNYEGTQVIDSGHGTSLFDRENVFGKKHWLNFTIPEGTVIPDSLRIRHTGHNDVYKAEHYQIEAATGRMQLIAYKGALDNLARNAIEKLYRDARKLKDTKG